MDASQNLEGGIHFVFAWIRLLLLSNSLFVSFHTCFFYAHYV